LLITSLKFIFKFRKPGLGPKEAEGGTPHHLKTGEAIIGLQAGSSKGATQSGMVSVLILKMKFGLGNLYYWGIYIRELFGNPTAIQFLDLS